MVLIKFKASIVKILITRLRNKMALRKEAKKLRNLRIRNRIVEMMMTMTSTTIHTLALSALTNQLLWLMKVKKSLEKMLRVLKKAKKVVLHSMLNLKIFTI